MRSVVASALVALSVAVFAAQANAAPIKYEFRGVNSGSIGGTSFTDALVVYTGTADTANIVSGEPFPGLFVYALALDGLTVNIAGIGTATVTDPTMVFGIPVALDDTQDPDNELPPFPLVILGRIDNPPALDSFTGMAATGSNALGGYQLDAAIGPIVGVGGVGFINQCGQPGHDACIGTSMGALSFVSNILDERGGTFTAIRPAPEPGTLALMGAGVAAFVRRSRRGRR
jgi:hypothetical protein